MTATTTGIGQVALDIAGNAGKGIRQEALGAEGHAAGMIQGGSNIDVGGWGQVTHIFIAIVNGIVVINHVALPLSTIGILSFHVPIVSIKGSGCIGKGGIKPGLGGSNLSDVPETWPVEYG